MYRLHFHILLFIFLLNVLVSNAREYLPIENIHLIRAYIMIFFIIIVLPFVEVKKFAIPLYLFVLYTLTLTFFSSNFNTSFSSLLRNILPLLIFLPAFQLFEKFGNHNTLSKIIIISMFLMVINIILAQLIRFGPNPYGASAIFLGGGGVTQSFLLVFLILAMPIVFINKNTRKPRWKLLLLVLLSVLTVLAIGRRGASLGLITGLLTYMIFTYRKTKLLFILIIPLFIILFVSEVYMEKLSAVYTERRMEEIDNPMQVGRFVEFEWALNLMSEKGINQILFGSEIYNYQAISGSQRPLHNDFATYLIGAGVIGLTLYLSIFYTIFRRFRIYSFYIKEVEIKKELSASFYALIVSALVMSISGLYYAISAMTVLFILLAAILSQAKNIALDNFTNNL